jgi:hypothetical protein
MMISTAVISIMLIASGSPPIWIAPVERPVPGEGLDAILQYDDGTAQWLTWGGTYRGVWFHVEDFLPYDTEVDTLEYWFYHHSSYPWDVTSFYAELWSGDESGPVTQLFQESVSAAHNTVIYVEVDPPINPGPDFWVIANTEMSSGGWPALLGDNTPNWTGYDHSFFSDDFFAWEPWLNSNDLFIRCGVNELGLVPVTWTELKALFCGPCSAGSPEHEQAGH